MSIHWIFRVNMLRKTKGTTDKKLIAKAKRLHAEQKAIQAQAKAKAKILADQAEKLHAQAIADQRNKRKQCLDDLAPENYERNKAKVLKSVETKDADLPDYSCEEMISELAQSMEDGDNVKENEMRQIIEKNFWRCILIQSSSECNTNLNALLAFHFVCLESGLGLDDMQKFQEKLAVQPWSLFNRQTKQMFHVRHYLVQQPTAVTGVLSWWLLEIIDCIARGLRHALIRKNIQQIEGATAFIFCNFSMRHEDNIFNPPNGFQNCQSFRVCNHPIFPDCVLKIIFGATGLFHGATQI